jgi:hypothetical protein
VISSLKRLKVFPWNKHWVKGLTAMAEFEITPWTHRALVAAELMASQVHLVLERGSIDLSWDLYPFPARRAAILAAAHD